MKKALQSIKCFFGLHKNYGWHPYPTLYPECTVDRCEHCDHYEWR